MKKRILSMLLAICMMFTMAPTVAFAQNTYATQGSTSAPQQQATDAPQVSESAEQKICSCTALCTQDAVNDECAVCANGFAACAFAQETSEERTDVENVVTLFMALPAADSITASITQEEKQALMQQAEVAAAAYDALTDAQKAQFEAEHAALLQAALALNDAITGSGAENSPATFGISDNEVVYVITQNSTQFDLSVDGVQKTTDTLSNIIKAISTSAKMNTDIKTIIQFGNGTETLALDSYNDGSTTIDFDCKITGKSKLYQSASSPTRREMFYVIGGANVEFNGEFESASGNVINTATNACSITVSGGSLTSATRETIYISVCDATLTISDARVYSNSNCAIYSNGTGKITLGAYANIITNASASSFTMAAIGLSCTDTAATDTVVLEVNGGNISSINNCSVATLSAHVTGLSFHRHRSKTFWRATPRRCATPDD